jgi:hypothetical protein
MTAVLVIRLQCVPVTLNRSVGVMAELVPAIRFFFWLKAREKNVDAREDGSRRVTRRVFLRGHDGGDVIRSYRNAHEFGRIPVVHY